MLYQQVDHCRSCGSDKLPQVLDLGFFYLSDFQDTPDAFVDKAPLELVRCEGCSLVQLRHTVDRDRLYKQYWYRSGTQPAMVSALRDVVRCATERVALNEGDVVVDIGANDGTLLRLYPPGLRRIAYEPAENLWPALQGTGWDNTRELSAIYGYFPQTIAGGVVGMDPPAKVITSIACFYDVDDPNQFVEGIKKCLAPDGIWINQLAYLPETLYTGNFGDFVHEHLTYWTIQSMAMLLERHEMRIASWSFNDVNGGSVRFIVKHGRNTLQSSYGPGMAEWGQFRERIRQQRNDVRDFLIGCRQKGQKVIGYGASTKGNTYLQFWNIGPDLLPLIADRNYDKVGKYTPTGQHIISEGEARDLEPDYFFVLPWHFLDAFVERERRFLKSGGQFVVPFPSLHLVGGDRANLHSETTVPDDGAVLRP